SAFPSPVTNFFILIVFNEATLTPYVSCNLTLIQAQSPASFLVVFKFFGEFKSSIATFNSFSLAGEDF
ncbi:MAG: hypothetical protein AABY22_00285, partial [Nanoarchaeota archaeon]